MLTLTLMPLPSELRLPRLPLTSLPQVQNPGSINPVTGKPVAFKLMPGTPCPPLLAHVSAEGPWQAAEQFAWLHCSILPAMAVDVD